MYLTDELTGERSVDMISTGGDRAVFLREVLDGLLGSPKTLPCKYFYDRRGSELFDRICELDEYYVTRVELSIMQAHAAEMAARFAPGDVLVELGSGSSLKTRLLLDRLAGHISAYVPVDISSNHLDDVAAELRVQYPSLDVCPVAGDYTKPFAIPINSGRRVMVYFPGSTIGNFHPSEAAAFMRSIRRICGRGGGLLIGVDLQKDPHVIERAYNDSLGVTAQFNLNVLSRINRELSADFDLSAYKHMAIYNLRDGRIEMHLRSMVDQTVTLGEYEIGFEAGETIWTESSYKHTRSGFAELACEAGFDVEALWTDGQGWFGVHMLRAM